MKTPALSLVLWLLCFDVNAQAILFGLTNEVKTDRLYLTVNGPNNLSYSVQYTPENTNSFASISLPGGLINGKITFIQTNTAQVGYYRGLTVSNSTTYYSTNLSLVFKGNVGVSNGNRYLSVSGPTNRAYSIESSGNLTNWTPTFSGIVGQTNFIDPGVSTRFYRFKSQ